MIARTLRVAGGLFALLRTGLIAGLALAALIYPLAAIGGMGAKKGADEPAMPAGALRESRPAQTTHVYAADRTTMLAQSRVFAAVRRPIAGKSGTTDDDRSAWFVGMTPGLTVAGFIADPDNPVHRVGAGNAGKPRETVAETMRDALAGTPVRGFVAPGPQIVGRKPAAKPRTRGRVWSARPYRMSEGSNDQLSRSTRPLASDPALRISPSYVNPAFSATRREATFPGATRSSMRWNRCSSSSESASTSTASGATPYPRASAATA